MSKFEFESESESEGGIRLSIICRDSVNHSQYQDVKEKKKAGLMLLYAGKSTKASIYHCMQNSR